MNASGKIIHTLRKKLYFIPTRLAIIFKKGKMASVDNDA